MTKIVNGDEEIVREMTEAEHADFLASQEALAQLAAEKEAKVIAKAALLERLGITEEEAALLLG